MADVRRGIIAKNLKSVRLENLRDIELNQTIMERILGIGSLGFSTAGSVGAEVIFTGVLHPQKVKDQVEEFLRQ